MSVNFEEEVLCYNSTTVADLGTNDNCRPPGFVLPNYKSDDSQSETLSG